MFDKPICGIYLLRDETGSVVYVGQSKNCLARIGAHTEDDSKSFVSVTIIPKDQAELDDWEGFLIRALCPSQQGTEGPQSRFWTGAVHMGQLPASKDGRLLKVNYVVPEQDLPPARDRQERQSVEVDYRPARPLSPDLLYTVKECAHFIGCSVATIWRWRANGTFPQPVRVSNYVTRWRGGDIIKFMESRHAV